MTPPSPAAITADGSSRASATVDVSDASGAGVAGAPLQLSASDPGARFGPIIDHGDGSYTVSVIASTTAHRIVVTAADGGLSASSPLTLVHGSARSVLVSLGRSMLVANGLSSTTATVVVSDAHGNRIPGDAITLHASNATTTFGPVADAGNGVYRATLVSPTSPGTDTIRATDLSATPVPAGTATLTTTPAPSLLSVVTMQWSFYYTRAYTAVRGLVITGAPRAASVRLSCTGRGCPFATVTYAAAKQPRCPAHPSRPCRAGMSLVFTPRLAARQLAPGARLTVAVVRPGWIGKFYGFRMRSASGPAIRISCLAPAGTQPGAGC